MIRELLARHDLRPKKALGQHFLADPNLVERIVRTASLGPQSRVVEVGAGTGTLTAALAKTGRRVLAYEIDVELAPVLGETVGGLGNVEVRYEEATPAVLAAALEGDKWTLVANLPYNVGTPLLLDLLRTVPGVERFVVMVQREVADRLVAGPGSKTYGIPSVAAQLRSDVLLAFGVPPQVFVPPPQVESAVVVLNRIDSPAAVDRAEELAAAAFNQRRKMMRRSLAGILDDAGHVLAEAGIDPRARPEDLEPQAFVRLAEVAS